MTGGKVFIPEEKAGPVKNFFICQLCVINKVLKARLQAILIYFSKSFFSPREAINVPSSKGFLCSG